MALNDSFETLKNMIADVAMAATRVTKSAAAVTKANINILTEQDKLKKAYMELGKLYYRDYITGEEPDDAEYLPLCDAISEATKNIDELRTTVKDIRSAKPSEEAEPEEAPAEAAESQVAEELNNLNKELDDLEKGLKDMDPVETVQEAVFEVVEDKPDSPKSEE